MSRPALTSSSPAPTRPATPGLWRALHGALGREMFGRPAGPWGAMFAPVPLAGAALLLSRQLLIAAGVAPWIVNLVGELGWLCFMPFVMATGGQAIARARSDDRWRESEGEHHLDYSPRRWHYGLGLAIAALPIALLQVWPRALELYLGMSLWLRTGLGLAGAGHVGYNPGLLHLLALLAVPAVIWQAERLIRLVPCGRLLGLQRELARLRGAVSWEPEPWGALVADRFDAWFADLSPGQAQDGPASEKRRRRRVRWAGLRREVVASFTSLPPDLPRANRALHAYRRGPL